MTFDDSDLVIFWLMEGVLHFPYNANLLYIYINIYMTQMVSHIYENLSKNPIVRLPHSRSRDSQSYDLVHWCTNTPQKYYLLFLTKSPSLLNLQTVHAPQFQPISVIFWFFVTPPLKARFFTEPQNIKVFHPSHQVTKSSLKISQFEFFVTKEKSIFVYKLFLQLNISDFIQFTFYVKIATLSLKKVTPPFPATPSEIEVLSSSPPHFENLVGGSTPQ